MPVSSEKIKQIVDSIYVKGAPITTKTNLATVISGLTLEKNTKQGVESFWGASSADDARDDHMPYYDELVNDAPILPCEEYGCQCGIYTKESPKEPEEIVVAEAPTPQSPEIDVKGVKDAVYLNIGKPYAIRETDKAIGFVEKKYNHSSLGEKWQKVSQETYLSTTWFPKSFAFQKGEDVFVADWLARKNLDWHITNKALDKVKAGEASKVFARGKGGNESYGAVFVKDGKIQEQIKKEIKKKK